MLTVKALMDLLRVLPPHTKILTSGLEGIHPAELGNLFPLKVLESKFGIFLYIDDGISYHHGVTDKWIPLDEFFNCGTTELQ